MDSNESEDNCSDINYREPWKDGEEKERLVHLYFWLQGVVRSSIAGTGVLVNIFSIVILSSKELRSTFHMFLVVLCCFDLGYLICTLLEEIPQMYDIITQGTTYPDPGCKVNIVWVYLYPLVIHPFQYIFLTSSENFTIVLSVDRFIAVKYPLRYYSSWRSSTFNKKGPDQRRKKGVAEKIRKVPSKVDKSRVVIYSLSAFLFSLLYCIPVFYEHETVLGNETNPSTIKESKMVKKEVYIMGYYVILDSICRFALPVCILSYTNYGIYQIVKKYGSITNELRSIERAQNMMLFGMRNFLSPQNIEHAELTSLI